MERDELDSVTFVFFMANMFLSCLGSYMIIPSSLYYVDYLGSTPTFLGIIMATHSIGTILFTPVLGKLTDKLMHADLVLYIASLGYAIGNLIYSIPISVYYPLFGRLVIGISASSQAFFYAETVKKSAAGKRLQRLLLLTAMCDLGTCIGPFFGALLQFNVTAFNLVINPGNSPSVVLVLLWVLMVCVLLVRHYVKWKRKEVHQTKNALSILDYESLEDLEEFSQLKRSNLGTVLCLLYFTLLMGIMVSVVDICTQVIAKGLFHSNLLLIKMIFAIGICLIFITYLTVYIIGSWLSDRFIFTIVIFLLVVSPIMLGVMTIFWDVLTITWFFLLIPFFTCGLIGEVGFALCCTLIVKVINPKDTGFYQNVTFTILCCGHLAGYVMLVFILNDAPYSLFILSIVFVVMWLIGIIWLIIFSYKMLA